MNNIYVCRRIDISEYEKIRDLFFGVFTNEPWCDNWSDDNQLQLYLYDVAGQNNSLTFGLYEEKELIGVSMGHVRHWYTGTEYYIDELCISTVKQGKGLGTLFVGEIERACKELGLSRIFLLTENDVPAYECYKQRGFYELQNKAAFAKRL